MGSSAADILIRPFDVGDVEALHRIHTACLTRTLINHYPAAAIAAWQAGRTPEGYAAAARMGERFWVAHRVGAVVAFASWQDDELRALFVDPDFHGEGLGSRLVRACDADADAQGKALVWVKSALGAERFYQRHGFVAVGPGHTLKRGERIPDLRMVRGGAGSSRDESGE